MKQVVDVNQKYAASTCNNPLQMSTLAATAALTTLLAPFGSNPDTYAITLGFSGGPFHLAEMTADKVPPTKPLLLDVDLTLPDGQHAVVNVGLAIEFLRDDQGNGANAIAQILNGNQDTILAQYVRAKHPEIIAELNTAAAAVVAVEDAAA